MNDVIYWTVHQICESNKYPFTMGQLRCFLQNRKKNGLDATIRKIGKRLYIRMDLFEKWVEQQAERVESV